MPVIIDPTQPANAVQLNCLFTLIDLSESLQITRVHRTDINADNEKVPYKINDEEIQLKYGLRKSIAGNRWWVVEDVLGKGSNNTKVKLLPYYYQKTSSGKYQLLKANTDSVLKVLRQSLVERPGDNPWENLLTFAKHEFEGLSKIDKNAELFHDREVGKAYIKSSKVKGKSLDKYLSDHPELTYKQRLNLIKLVAKAVLNLHEKYNMAHLDLKLENIFYDEKAETISLIDFGSWQPLTARLEEVNSKLHMTTPRLDPLDHDHNSPAQIDAYSCAGIFGLILSDWSSQNVWALMPIMSIKNKNAVLGTYILTKDPNKRCYDFNLPNVPSDVLSLLRRLGQEKSDTRMTLLEFHDEIEKKMGKKKESFSLTRSLDLDPKLFSEKQKKKLTGSQNSPNQSPRK